MLRTAQFGNPVGGLAGELVGCGQSAGIGVIQKNAPSFGSSTGAGLNPPTL